MAHPVATAYDAILSTPWPGIKLGICVEQNTLSTIDFVSAQRADTLPGKGVAATVAQQLKIYFNNPQQRFTLPVTLRGTPFQQRVWRALQGIPVGHTCSYGELARRLRTSPRAIGNACRANPIPIVIACHRVVATQGIGGYSGKTSGALLNTKRWLLEHESGA
jgi:methylated-DNA-[protein]-cysteine S-methyltransferase